MWSVIFYLEDLIKTNPSDWKQQLKNYTNQLRSQQKVRTDNQNRALHLWFQLVADALNDGGYSVQLILKHKVDLQWDKDKVKYLLWHPAQQAILGKKSTTQLRKLTDIDVVWEHLNRHLAEKFQIHVPFPDNSDSRKTNIYNNINYPDRNEDEIPFET